MDQQATIKLLNSIMPEIAETRNPEKAMLKCAKAHNLTPAMLEKLGHVFNTAKTLVGLEKMANRGDSFAIVDVPKMVKDYTTYDPSATLSKADQKVHDKVELLTKDAGDADIWRSLLTGKLEKAASTKNDWIFEEPNELPDLGIIISKSVNNYGGDVQYTDTDTDAAWTQVKIEASPADIQHPDLLKAAGAELMPLYKLDPIVLEARRSVEDVKLAANADMFKKIASIKEYVSWDANRWQEIVEDATTMMTKSALAEVKGMVEEYFEQDKLHIAPVDLEKVAALSLPRDRHNLAESLTEISELNAIVKEASAQLENLQKTYDEHVEALEKKAAEDGKKSGDSLLAKMVAPIAGIPAGITGSVDSVNNTWKAINNTVETLGGGSNSRQKNVDDAIATAAKDATLQRLMLSDPIIQAADPYEVQDLYHAVADVSPALAKNPLLMAAIIKEQLQYGSVPIQTTKDLATVEKTLADTEKAKQAIDKDKYQK